MPSNLAGVEGLFGPGRASPLRGRPTGVDATEDSGRMATSCRLKTRAVLSSPPGVILPVVALAQGHRGTPNDSCRRILGRGDRIRTCDIYVPNVALYQSELRPVREPVGQAPGRAVYDYKTDSSTRSASGPTDAVITKCELVR